MRPSTTGYSGTPLAKKLGIKPDAHLVTENAPENYLALLEPLPEGVTLGPLLEERAAFVHLFVSEAGTLVERLVYWFLRLQPDGMIWVSWPKQASKVPTDITEQTVRDIALPLGLVDVKVCAIDATWSGLKLVLRRELRPSKT